MRYEKVLSNQNTIISEITNKGSYGSDQSNFSINVVFHGSEAYTVGKRRINLFPGNFLVLNHGTVYKSEIRSLDPVQAFCVQFDRSYILDFRRSMEATEKQLLDQPQGVDYNPWNFLETLHPLQGDMKYNLLHLKRTLEEGAADELLFNEYLYHCLLNYYRIYNNEVFTKSRSLQIMNTATRDEIVRRLTVAKDYIISNYSKDLKLEEIAGNAFMSVNHLLRNFKQAYNMSPHQFLTEVRLKQARHLLKTTKYPVNEIVQIVGFEDPSSFSRLFKNTFRVTPKTFRMN